MARAPPTRPPSSARPSSSRPPSSARAAASAAARPSSSASSRRVQLPPSQRSRRKNGASAVRTSSADVGIPGQSGTKRNAACCGCCSIPVFLLLFAVLCAAGGVVLWRFLPSSTKESVRGVLPLGNRDGSGASGAGDYQGEEEDGGGGGGGGLNIGRCDGVPPPPSFPFYTLCNDRATCCNGIEGLCDVPADRVMYAALHNAGSAVENGFFIAGNHEYSLEDALEHGFRGINLDLGVCGTGRELKVIHGNCRLGSRDPLEVFTNVGTFMRENPREVVLMPVEIVTDDDGNKPSLQQIYDVMAEAGVVDLMYHQDPAEADQDWPTLQQLVDVDQRLLFFYYNSEDCNHQTCPDKFQEWFRYAAETPFSYEDVDSLRNTDSSCVVGRGKQGTYKFYALNLFVSNPLPSKQSSVTINSKDFLQNMIDNCEATSGLDVNVLFLDFWSNGDAVEVVQLENERRAAAYVEEQQQQQQQEAEEVADENVGQRQLLLRGKQRQQQQLEKWSPWRLLWNRSRSY